MFWGLIYVNYSPCFYGKQIALSIFVTFYNIVMRENNVTPKWLERSPIDCH